MNNRRSKLTSYSLMQTTQLFIVYIFVLRLDCTPIKTRATILSLWRHGWFYRKFYSCASIEEFTVNPPSYCCRQPFFADFHEMFSTHRHWFCVGLCRYHGDRYVPLLLRKVTPGMSPYLLGKRELYGGYLHQRHFTVLGHVSKYGSVALML